MTQQTSAERDVCAVAETFVFYDSGFRTAHGVEPTNVVLRVSTGLVLSSLKRKGLLSCS